MSKIVTLVFKPTRAFPNGRACAVGSLNAAIEQGDSELKDGSDRVPACVVAGKPGDDWHNADDREVLHEWGKS